jgi:hypothetical protein
MKSFSQILSNLGGKMLDGINLPSWLGSSKMSHKNRRPNRFRRMHKPLYGGWAHRTEAIGQVPAVSLDGLRAVEVITGMNLMSDSRGVYQTIQVERTNRFDEIMSLKRAKGDHLSEGTRVREIVRDIMERFLIDVYVVKPTESLRIDLMKRYGIGFTIDWDDYELVKNTI